MSPYLTMCYVFICNACPDDRKEKKIRSPSFQNDSSEIRQKQKRKKKKKQKKSKKEKKNNK